VVRDCCRNQVYPVVSCVMVVAKADRGVHTSTSCCEPAFSLLIRTPQVRCAAKFIDGLCLCLANNLCALRCLFTQEQAEANRRNIAPAPLHALHGTPWQTSASTTPCHFWHAGHSCSGHVLSVMPPTYLRALGVYLPVYLLPALLVHRCDRDTSWHGIAWLAWMYVLGMVGWVEPSS
jgi:hypothetical protein